MNFELSDEQRQLADSLGRLLQDRYDFEARSKRLARPGGVDDAIWKQVAELGVLALPLTEQAGGFGGGAVDLMQPMALFGQALALEPFNAQLTAAVLLDRLSAARGTAARADVLALLQACASGEQRLAWAHLDANSDSGGGDPVRLVDGKLNGSKVAVDGASQADLLLVTVAADGRGSDTAPAIYLVATAQAGVKIQGYVELDNRRSARVSFANVAVDGPAPAGQVGQPGEPTREAISAALDFSSALLCAEAMGLIEFACAETLEYLKTRKQFGVPIGSFQALQHRIVDLYVELEMVRSMTALACSRVDGASAGQVAPAERRRAVAAARVYIARAARKVSQESVQLHGGMGMAEEMKISHAFRRLTLLQRQGGHESDYLDQFIGLTAADAAASARGGAGAGAGHAAAAQA